MVVELFCGHCGASGKSVDCKECPTCKKRYHGACPNNCEPIVWVAETGKEYHPHHGCHSASIPLPITKAKARGLAPCMIFRWVPLECDDEVSEEDDAIPEETRVFRTKTGTKFHPHIGCHKATTEISVAEARRRGLMPCNHLRAPANAKPASDEDDAIPEGTRVYRTKTAMKFHPHSGCHGATIEMSVIGALRLGLTPCNQYAASAKAKSVSETLAWVLARQFSTHVLILDNPREVQEHITELDYHNVIAKVKWQLALECDEATVTKVVCDPALPSSLIRASGSIAEFAMAPHDTSTSPDNTVAVTIIVAEGKSISPQACNVIAALRKNGGELVYSVLCVSKSQRGQKVVSESVDASLRIAIDRLNTYNESISCARCHVTCRHKVFVPPHLLTYLSQQEADQDHHGDTRLMLNGLANVELVAPLGSDTPSLDSLVDFVCLRKPVPWEAVQSSLPVPRGTNSVEHQLTKAFRELHSLHSIGRPQGPHRVLVRRVPHMCGASTLLRYAAMQHAKTHLQDIVVFLSDHFSAHNGPNVMLLVGRLKQLMSTHPRARVIVFVDLFDASNVFFGQLKNRGIDGVVFIHWIAASANDKRALSTPSDFELQAMIDYSQKILDEKFGASSEPLLPREDFVSDLQSIKAPEVRPLLWGVLSLLLSGERRYNVGNELVQALKSSIEVNQDADRVAGAVIAVMHGFGRLPVQVYLLESIGFKVETGFTHNRKPTLRVAAPKMPFGVLLAQRNSSSPTLGFPSAAIARFSLQLLALEHDEKLRVFKKVIDMLGPRTRDPSKTTEESELFYRIFCGEKFDEYENNDDEFKSKRDKSALDVLFQSISPTQCRRAFLDVFTHINEVAPLNYHYIIWRCSLLQIPSHASVEISRDDHTLAIALMDKLTNLLPPELLVHKSLTRRRLISWCLKHKLLFGRTLFFECVNGFEKARQNLTCEIPFGVIGPYFQEVGMLLSVLHPVASAYCEKRNVNLQVNRTDILVSDDGKVIHGAFTVITVQGRNVNIVEPNRNNSGCFTTAVVGDDPAKGLRVEAVDALFIRKCDWNSINDDAREQRLLGAAWVILFDVPSPYGETQSKLIDHARDPEASGSSKVATLWNYFLSIAPRVWMDGRSASRYVLKSMLSNIARGIDPEHHGTNAFQRIDEVARRANVHRAHFNCNDNSRRTASTIAFELALCFYAVVELSGCSCAASPSSQCTSADELAHLLDDVTEPAIGAKHQPLPKLNTIEDADVLGAVVKHAVPQPRRQALDDAIDALRPRLCTDHSRNKLSFMAGQYAKILEHMRRVQLSHVGGSGGIKHSVSHDIHKVLASTTLEFVSNGNNCVAYNFYVRGDVVMPVRVLTVSYRHACRVGWKPLTLQVSQSPLNPLMLCFVGTDVTVTVNEHWLDSYFKVTAKNGHVRLVLMDHGKLRLSLPKPEHHLEDEEDLEVVTEDVGPVTLETNEVLRLLQGIQASKPDFDAQAVWNMLSEQGFTTVDVLRELVLPENAADLQKFVAKLGDRMALQRRLKEWK